MLNAMRHIFYMEILLQWRHSRECLYALGFYVVVISLFPIALTPDPVLLKKLAAGCIWIALLLANLLAVQNTFLSDTEDGFIEQLILSPLPLYCSLLAKLAAIWVVTALPLLLLTPLMGWLFALSNHAILFLSLSLLIGTPLLTFLGCLSTALTLGLKQQGTLLGIIFLPLSIPILIFGVSLVEQAENHLAISGILAFLAGCSLLAIIILPWIISIVLNLSLMD